VQHLQALLQLRDRVGDLDKVAIEGLAATVTPWIAVASRFASLNLIAP
jgi:hypothetical protein